jgi:hypothetical protein
VVTEYWRVGDRKKRFCKTDAEEPKIELKPAKKKDTRKSPSKEKKSSVNKSDPLAFGILKSQKPFDPNYSLTTP